MNDAQQKNASDWGGLVSAYKECISIVLLLYIVNLFLILADGFIDPFKQLKQNESEHGLIVNC